MALLIPSHGWTCMVVVLIACLQESSAAAGITFTRWPRGPIVIEYGTRDYNLIWAYEVNNKTLDDLIYFYKGSTRVGSLRISSREVNMFGGFASSHNISTTDQATLIIKNATMSDAGNYSMELTDATYGTTYIKSVIVRVEGILKITSCPQSPVNITYGAIDYLLKWTYVVGGRSLDDLIYFYKGSTRVGSLRISSRQVTMFGGFATSHDISTTDQATLIIKNATMSDAGNYSVLLTDATDGTTYIKSVIVRVEAFIKFRIWPSSPVTITQGTQNYQLKWTYLVGGGNLDDLIYFYKGSTRVGSLKISTRQVTMFGGFASSHDISTTDQATLIIENATMSDAGNYSVELTDATDGTTYIKSVIVRVEGFASFTSSFNNPVYILEGTLSSLRWTYRTTEAIDRVVFWKDGVQIGELSNNTKLIRQGFGSSLDISESDQATLIIKNATQSDEGVYQCEIIDVNQNTYKQNATVKFTVPLVVRSNGNVTVNETESTVLSCSVSEGVAPPPSVTWSRDGQQRGAGDSLTISSAGRADTGSYRCTAKSGNQPVVSDDVYLNVQYKATNVTLRSSTYTTCVNQEVVLSCTGGSNPSPYSYDFVINEKTYTSNTGTLTHNPTAAGVMDVTCVPQNRAGPGENATVEVLIKAPPMITRPTPSQTAVEGANVTLVCDATGSSPLNTTWLRDGRIVASGENLLIPSIGRDEEGEYVCQAENSCSAAKSTAQIQVDFKPENLSMTLTPSIHRACQGQSVQVTCLSTAKPAANHSLYLNGEIIAHTVSGGLGSTVRLNNSGSNVFRCDAQNKAGSDTETIDSIEIEGIPVITSKLSSLTFNEGDQASFHCNATGFPTPNVTWIRLGDGRQWLGSPIVFPNISRGDEGVYRCTASTGDECRNATLDIDVIINTKPKDTILTKSIGSAVCVNSSMRLSCISTSKPAATKFTFYKDNVEIANTSSGNITVTLSTQGTHQFTCVPENVAGTGENATVTVLVKGVPVITSKKTSLTFNEGESATLNCNATGYPTPEVTLIRLEDGRQWFGSQIVFQNISREYDGVYRCAAISGAECRNVTLDVHVSVNSKPENTSLIKSVGSAVCVNSSMRLSCTSASKPATTKFTFYKNEVEIANTSSGNITFTLSTQGTQRFTCVPENVAGTGAIATVTVLVKAPPVIAPFTASQFTVNETSDFSLHCDVTGSPPVSITWSRHGEPLLVQGAWLNMTSVTPVHEGVYTCRADNGDECASHERSVQIAVNFKPRNTTLLTNASDVTVLQGKSLALSCESRAKPSSCDFTFYQDDVALVTLPGICEEGSVMSHEINSVRGCGNTTFACLSKNMISGGSWSNITLEIQDPPTTAISPDAERTLNIGDNLQLNCSATGCPIPTLTWLKGSQIIARRRGFALPINILNAQLSDEGEYRCIADNGVSGGHPRQQIRVVVNKPDNISLTLSPSIHRACQGQSVLVTCSSTAKPAANHSLYLNEVKIGQTVSENLSQSVRLNSTETNMFRCVSQTSTGSAVNITHSIEVEGIPVITSEQSSHSFNEGDQASLYCNATGYPTPNINWTRLGDGRQWFGSPILFPNISRGEAGVYRCTASTGDQCRDATLDVNVIVKSSSQIVSVSVQPALTQVRKNETVTLECITSLPSPHVTWFDVQGVVIGNQSSLVFVATNTSSGVYTCAVRSTAGRTVNSSAVVLVQSPVYTVYCIIKLPNETFQGALSDPTSDLYKNQAAYYQILLSGWFEEYANNTGVANVTVTGFGNGSLVVEFTLTMLAYARDPLLPLRLEAARNRGYINGTLVDLIYYFPLAMPVLYNITLQTHGLAFIWAYPKAPLLAQCKADVSRLHDASVQRTCEIEGSTGKLSCAVDRLDPGKRHVVYITCRNEFGFNNITTYAKTIDVVSCPPEDEVNRIIMGFAIAGGILIFIIFMVVCCYACRAEDRKKATYSPTKRFKKEMLENNGYRDDDM